MKQFSYNILFRYLALLLVAFIAAAPPSVEAQGFGVAMFSSQSSGDPVGTKVTWVAIPQNHSGPLPPEYRFDVRPAGKEWRLLRDFSGWALFMWTSLEEGSYEFRVIARDPNTGEQAEAIEPFLLTSKLTGSTPDVFSTLHPLVALYSVPPCSLGSVRVRFREQTSASWQYTPAKPCQSPKSINFYIAGMVADTDYLIQQEWLVAGALMRGPLLTHHTGVLPLLPFVNAYPVFSEAGAISVRDPIILHSSPSLPGRDDISFPFAMDLAGRLVWYYDRLAPSARPYSHLTQPVPGGTMLIICSEEFRYQVLREIDLEGNVVRETRVQNVAEQLQSMGEDPIIAFHHDAIRLQNGHTLVLGMVERIVTDLQGPGSVNVLGDMLVDLDENFQVQWVWNGFEKLDISRKAILGEVCESDGPGCPHLYLDTQANDWTHSNTIAYSPADNNVVISLRNLDWAIKIDYRDGVGNGDVLWRLGKGGDFDIVSDDSYPWFSHQHDVEYDGRDSTLTIYDNGNTRRQLFDSTANSRGQVLQINEPLKIATLMHNFDLGDYAWALGSAERLSNGNYSFLSGALSIFGGPGFSFSQSLEVTPQQAETYRQDVVGSIYRSYRMQNLYTPN